MGGFHWLRTSAISRNFCGSVETVAVPTSDGGTNVLFEIIGTGDGVPLAAFTAPGLTVLVKETHATSAPVNAAADTECDEDCHTTTTPEPASLALFATGLLGVGVPVLRWRRR